MSCGAALERRCATCGSEVPAEARFCPSCGAALTPAAPAQPEAPARTPEERRTVTILFADLSGYTAVAEKLDPEVVKGLLDEILGRLAEEVSRHGGTVDKYIGDNVMALFGAPVAHEDDPERAVRAALAMQAAIEQINEPLRARHEVSFSLRIGINTGEVLAGTVGEGYTVVGDAVNVAARLQAAANPGCVTVGERTYRATRQAVEYRALEEALELKGKKEPVLAWEAVGPGAAVRPSVREPTHAPMIGRADELALLDGLVERVKRDGRPHVVTVIGEAGVGKSRLLRELEHELEQRSVLIRRGRCLPYGSGIVYWPLAEMLRAECEIVDGEPSETAYEKLFRRLAELLSTGSREEDRSAPAKVAVVGRLLGMEPPADVELPDPEDAQRTRELFFSAMRGCVEGMARERPLVLAWEDIHWADQGMLDLIEHLGQWARAPVLQVCLARDELLSRRPGWSGARRSATTMFLEPLDEAETLELVQALLQSGHVAGQVAGTIAARAEGNPLFAEEMVRLLAAEESATASELPETVQALLAARLDALEPIERRILAHAAVVGRTFWEAALEPVAAAEGAELGTVLGALREKDLVIAGEGASLSGEPELAFKHVLIRDVAYGMLPKAVRAQKHFEVAEFIEDRAGERLDEVVAVLAEHYGRGVQLAQDLKFESLPLGRYAPKALQYAERAGDAATALYSNDEAFSHYAFALGFAAGDEGAAARIGQKQGDVALRLGRVDAAIAAWERALDYHRRQEDLQRVAELHRKLGSAYAHKGDRKQAIEHHQRGINLIKDGPPSRELVRLYEEAAWLYVQTGDNMLAIYASEKALRLAERLDEPGAASRAHGIFGRVFGRIGDLSKARENLERAVELARGSDDHETVLALLALGTHLEEAEGDHEGAGDGYREALGLAEQIGDVPAQVELYAALAQLAAYTADWDELERYAETSAELAEREGLLGKLCLPYSLQGVVHWRSGEWDESARAYKRALELAEQVGYSEVSFGALYGLARTLWDAGDAVGADGFLARSLDVCERAGLIVQSIQAGATRAQLLDELGRGDQATETALQARKLAERVHHPVGDAASLEAGAVAEPAHAAEHLRGAAEAWAALGRPLEAARCLLLLAAHGGDVDPGARAKLLEEAADAYAKLGVGHRAERARALAVR